MSSLVYAVFDAARADSGASTSTSVRTLGDRASASAWPVFRCSLCKRGMLNAFGTQMCYCCRRFALGDPIADDEECTDCMACGADDTSVASSDSGVDTDDDMCGDGAEYTWTLVITQSPDRADKRCDHTVWGPFVYWTEAQALAGVQTELFRIIRQLSDDWDDLSDAACKFPGCFKLKGDDSGNADDGSAGAGVGESKNEYELEEACNQDAKLMTAIVEYMSNDQEIDVDVKRHKMPPRAPAVGTAA
jgi:hypothetical protein